MENTVLTQTETKLDHDSLLLACQIVENVKQLIRCIHAIVSVLVRYATIAVSISDYLTGCIMPAALEHGMHAERIDVSSQGISIMKLPLAV